MVVSDSGRAVFASQEGSLRYEFQNYILIVVLETSAIVSLPSIEESSTEVDVLFRMNKPAIVCKYCCCHYLQKPLETVSNCDK